jgi:hypothetical protein
MRDDEKLEITAGKIRKLAEKYEGIKTAFPEVFEERWETVEDGIVSVVKENTRGYFYIVLYHGTRAFVAIHSHGAPQILDDNYRQRIYPGYAFSFEHKVSPCPK